MTDDELASACEAAPDDADARMVYADWLEQRGDRRAALLRLAHDLWRTPTRDNVERLAELRATCDPLWVVRMARLSNAEIRRRVAVLDELDPKRVVFAAKSHRYALNPPLHPAELVALETRLGCTLPAQYRRFVGEIGDGGAGPCYGIDPIAKTTTTDLGASFKLPVRAEYDDADVEPGRDKRYWSWTSHGLFWLCDIGCGAGYWLVFSGTERGRVWIQDDAGEVVPVMLDGSEKSPDTEALLATPVDDHVEFLDWYVRWLDDALLEAMRCGGR